MSFSALLIGLGRVGSGYDLQLEPTRYVYTHARAMTTHTRFRLVAGVDVDSVQRQTFEAAYRIPAYAHVADLPPDSNVDVAIVATPTETHFRVIDDILACL